MSAKEKAVMALYPKAIGFGYAIFESPRSQIDCGVVKISPISNSKCIERIKKCIEYYEPTLVILQDLSGKGGYKSNRVKMLLNEITILCNTKHLPVKKYSREQIRFVFEQFGAKTKYEIAKTIVKWLPEFEHKMPKFRKPWMSEDYNMGQFDATSLTLTHYYLCE